ncbi:hypothetical protein HHL19_33670 [Streptomyces sp. R302]|uniref:hypothetical protein n=1 Tax=unclassified Streptomyces TaxID=2593676 RepID=UPI00145DC961|nr:MULTISPECIES: hypothetical protein [unclassified Streptomyces]NML54204.1 hypothetical protein [Streptomyces sp. R301]NML83464.1 hypothetical protein [Streptomyces sp. R302]
MGVFSRFRRKKQSMEESGEPASAELAESESASEAESESDSESDSESKSEAEAVESEAGGTVTRLTVPGVTAPEESSEIVEIPRQQSADTAADAGSGAGSDAGSDADSETGKAART